MEIITIFPSLILKETIKNYEKHKSKLIDFAYNERKLDPKGVIKSNEGGWHSDDKYASFSNPFSKIVIDLISQMLTKKQYFSIKEIKILNMWININEKGNSNGKHNHPGCDLSGVFWVKAPKDSGAIAFESPNLHSQFKQIKSFKNDSLEKLPALSSYNIKATEGTILLFNSSLDHWVLKNESNEDRISVSFNIDLNVA